MGDNCGSTGIYLVVEAAAGAIERLTAVLAVQRAQSVLVAPAGGTGWAGQRPDIELITRLVRIAQSADAAALVAEDMGLVETTGADGLHLPWSVDVERDYEAARRTIGRQRIVGASAGGSRHDAMVLAEAGADYIGFSGRTDDAADQLEIVTWWAEIFETPCVVFDVGSAEAARQLISAGADFIATRLPGGEAPADAAARVSMLGAVIATDGVGGRQ